MANPGAKETDKESHKSKSELSLSSYDSKVLEASGLFSEMIKSFHSYCPYQTITSEDGVLHERVVKGSSALDSMVKYACLSRESALSIAQILFKDGLFLPYANSSSNSFQDSEEMYTVDINLNIQGVFPSLTRCYSPTCSPLSSCYSPSCMRASWRNSSQDTLLKPLLASIGGKTSKKKAKTWSSSVSQDLLKSMSPKEIKRQEIIYELIYTEEEYIDDLKLIDKFFRIPMIKGFFGIENPEKMADEIFGKLTELIAVNQKLFEDLASRQEEADFVDYIGDIFINHLDKFPIYVEHCTTQIHSLALLEKLQKSHKDFKEYCTDKERSLQFRRLPLQSFLGRPRTRFARYQLILESVEKATVEPNSSDHKLIPTALEMLKKHLTKLNTEAGIYENRFRIDDLNERLTWKHDKSILGLEDKSRQLLSFGVLGKVGISDTTDMDLFLLDHSLIFAKKSKKVENGLVIYKEPFPLYLTKVSEDIPTEDSNNLSITKKKSHFFPSPTLSRKDTALRNKDAFQNPTDSFTFVITCEGKHFRQYIFKASSQQEKEQWMERINNAINNLSSNMKVANIVSRAVNLPIHWPNSKVHSATFCEDHMIIGTDVGIFGLAAGATTFKKLVDTVKVTQIDYSETYKLIIAIAGKDQELFTFPKETIVISTPLNTLVAVPNSSGASLFKIGRVIEKDMVVYIRNRVDTIDRSVKLLELIPKKGVKKFKSFSIPSECHSIRFLSKAIVVGTEVGGFQYINVETSETLDVIDPKDDRLKPLTPSNQSGAVTLLPIGENYLACFKEMCTLITKGGKLASEGYSINWLGTPTSFAVLGEHVVAFSRSLLEIWNTTTREVAQVRTYTGLTHLTDNQPPSTSNRILFSANGGPMNQHIIYELEPLEQKEVKKGISVVLKWIAMRRAMSQELRKDGEESD